MKEEYHMMIQDCLSKSKNKTSDLISIVIPVFNVEAYLHECLDSVVNQTYTNLEIILVDDGSTDLSGAICDEYAIKDERIRVIHKSNKGQGHSRNLGMNAAHGEYLIFLDSDDYWELNLIQTLRRIAKQDSVQVLAFSAESFWEGVECPGNGQNYDHQVQNGVIRTGPESMRIALEHHEYYTSPVLRFYYLPYLKKLGIRFDEGYIHEDESFSFLTYLFAERVECIGNRLYKRRFREGSTMTAKTQLKSAKGYADAVSTLLSYFQDRRLSKMERYLLGRYLNFLIGQINSLYDETIPAGVFSRKSISPVSEEIASAVKDTLKQSRILGIFLSSTYRISTYSLYLAYCTRKVKQSVWKRTANVMVRVRGS